MSAALLKDLRRRARDAELQLIERDEPGGLHVRVIGEKNVVHWWPDSRKQTAYVDGSAKGHSYASAKKVIDLAQGGAS